MQGRQKLSQQVLAKILKISHSVIGRYERDEMSPSIDAVKMAAILDTTVDYLFWENTEGKTLKDTAVLKRLNYIAALPDKHKEQILYTIDG